jgi:uncharacterized membrane protein YgcG
MNRLTFVMLCAGLCLVPILLFGALNGGSTPDGAGGYTRGGYYRRGPSFLFMSFGNNYGYSRGYSSGGYSRGRGYSSGGFRGGGSRAGK